MLGHSIRHNDDSYRKKLLSTVFSVLVVSNLLFALALSLFNHIVSDLVFSDGQYGYLIYPIIVATVFGSFIIGYFNNILTAYEKLFHLSLGNIVGAIFELVAIIGLSLQWGIEGALWGIALGNITWFLALTFFCLC